MFCQPWRQKTHKLLAGRSFFSRGECEWGGVGLGALWLILLLFSKRKCQRVIYGHIRKEQQKEIFRNRLKKLNFEDIIENKLDFYGNVTTKIEIQRQSGSINPFTCELREISYGIYNKITLHSSIPSKCVWSICLYLAILFPGSLGFLIKRKAISFKSKSQHSLGTRLCI